MSEVGRRLVGAVDIGNSKVDMLVLTETGDVVAWLRGGAVPPTLLGNRGSARALGDMLRSSGHVLDFSWFAAAGVDFPDQEQSFLDALVAEGGFGAIEVRNDIYAILACGSDPDRGIAVVVGAGMNAVGRVGEREVRFASLAEWSGDRGGGGYLGTMALIAACRAADGRGPATTLAERVRGHFGVENLDALSRALSEGETSSARLMELVPIVFEEARAGDGESLGIVHHQAHEVSDLVRASATRLKEPLDGLPIVLGGSILRFGRDLLEPVIRADLAPSELDLHFPDFPAILGAASAALEMCGISLSGEELAGRLDGISPTLVDTTRTGLLV